jgi:hypothetical protein
MRLRKPVLVSTTFLLALYALVTLTEATARAQGSAPAPAPGGTSVPAKDPPKDAAKEAPKDADSKKDVDGKRDVGAKMAVTAADSAKDARDSKATLRDESEDLEAKKPGLKQYFEVGVGLYGAGGVLGLAKPDNVTVTQSGITGQDPSYPGFFGGTGGMGFMVDVRFLGAVGLEFDAYYGFSERGSGNFTTRLGSAQTDYKIKIGQGAVHLPILLKGTLPFGPVRPFLGLGVEPVVPVSPETQVTVNPAPPAGTPAPLTFKNRADTYLLLTAALGAEIRLPIKQVDIRIPFSFRFSFNPSTSENIGDRRDAKFTVINSNPAQLRVDEVTYKSEWQFQGLFTLGAAIYFP